MAQLVGANNTPRISLITELLEWNSVGDVLRFEFRKSVAKQYCTCSGNDYIAYGLFAAGRSLRGEVEWVHSCGRPHFLYWEAAIRRCPECWENFSAPWEKLCKTCCAEERDLIQYPYRSWQWARGVKRPWEAVTTGGEPPLPAPPVEAVSNAILRFPD